MTTTQKISWLLLSLAAFIPAAFSLYYITVKNLPFALVAFLITLSIYTLLVFKDIKILSSVSFFTMLLMGMLICGITLDSSANKTGGVFASAFDEKTSMLARSSFLFFLLLNSVFWSKTKKGFKKLIARIFAAIAILMFMSFGTVPPGFYQNFIFTRIDIAILFIFGIYLFSTKKKLLGSLTILLSIGTLLLSVSMFKEKVYTLSDQERQEAITYIDPMAKEMFGYYNQKDYDHFCQYCGIILKELMKKSPIGDKRELFGPYIRFDQPSKVIRKGGRYYVVYPVKFQKIDNQMYLTFVTEGISSTPSLYGFAFSVNEEQYTSTGFDMEQDRSAISQ